MKLPKTERELAFEELEFQNKKLGNTLLGTSLGKLLIRFVEKLNQLLIKYCGDK